ERAGAVQVGLQHLHLDRARVERRTLAFDAHVPEAVHGVVRLENLRAAAGDHDVTLAERPGLLSRALGVQVAGVQISVRSYVFAVIQEGARAVWAQVGQPYPAAGVLPEVDDPGAVRHLRGRHRVTGLDHPDRWRRRPGDRR